MAFFRTGTKNGQQSADIPFDRRREETLWSGGSVSEEGKSSILFLNEQINAKRYTEIACAVHQRAHT